MPNARKIADYLRKNPQFLVEHPDLLAELQLPQPADSAADSDSDSPPPAVDERFRQRQVEVLRAQRQQQQARMDVMLDAARSNRDLERGLHHIALDLLDPNPHDLNDQDPQTPAALVQARFALDYAAIFLSSRQQHLDPQVDYPSLCQRVAHLASVCDDRVSAKSAAAWFPQAASATIGSCAFIPLAHRRNLRGVMILGAEDETRFQPDLGVWVLDRLGQLIGAYFAGRGLA